MYFIYEQNSALVTHEFGNDALEPLFKISAILGPGEQGAHIQRKNCAVQQHFRYLLVDNLFGNAFGDGGFADSGFADEERIILAAPAKDLDSPLHLVFAPDQRINLAEFRLLIQVGRVRFQRIFATFILAFLVIVAG